MQKGYLIVQTFTARRAIPVVGASVSVTEITNGNENLIGFRITDEEGKIEPIAIDAPDAEMSQSPHPGVPFTVCNIRIIHPMYDSIQINDVQIFPGVTTIQNVEMIPLEEYAQPGGQLHTYTVTPQNL